MAHRNMLINIADHIKQLIVHSFRYTWVFMPPGFLNGVVNPNQRQPNHGRWVAAPTRKPVISMGGEGIVHVWCLLDPQDIILDRVVVKQVHPGFFRFTHPDNWAGGNVGQEPRENEMSRLLFNTLAATGNQKHIASCLGYSDVRRQDRWRYRLYFEWCGYGSLAGRIEAQSKVPTRKQGRKYQKPFPEPFLWMLFEALAKVAVGMANTVTPNAPGGQVHGDMSAWNILFDAPDPGRFSLYPVPKVADFGSTRHLEPNIVQRGPLVLNDPCNSLFAPPELAQTHGVWDCANTAAAPMILSDRTNVWQVGMLMCCAMRLRPYLKEADRHGRGGARNQLPVNQQLQFTGPPGFRELPRHKFSHGRSSYSVQLINLVESCMRRDAANRPTAQALLQQVQQHMATRLHGTNASFPAGLANVPAHLKRYRIHMPLNDRYRVGKRLR